MAGATFDDSELRLLAADLARSGATLAPTILPIVTRGAVNIKRQMVDEMRSSTHFAPVARAISYDVVATPTFIEAQIGPRKGEPGSLANIAYFGSSRGGGGRVPDPQLALEAETPNFERFISEAAEGTL